MRVATWNINGLRARFDFVLHWLEARRPDIVGLQELKLEDEKFPHAEFEKVGYRAFTHGQKAWNGVAVLTRAPGDLVQTGLPGQEDFGSRLVTAKIGALTFTTVYCPNGKSVGHEDFPRKLAWFEALRAHLEAAHDPLEPHILCGDFNICPQPLDSWNEKGLAGRIFHTEEERERMRKLFDWGLTDLYRHQHPDRQAFSWWDYRGGAFHRNMGLRIDLLLATQPIVEESTAVEIDREYRKKKDGLTASDHAPVFLDLSP
ncbi:MAG: exodeoxyribonuclease III [Acidobacteriota bacterium]|nr:exodeoxyribonuclease III [Acidobacteriota bacterium]